jgi:hypothetical protein
MTRDSIVVEPLQTDAQGNPVMPTPAPAAGSPADLSTLSVPSDFDGVDERYRGKSVSEIIDMHKNAERKIGEQGNELHTWRNLVSEISQEQVKSAGVAPQPETETPLDLSADDLLQNPVEAISSVVERALNKHLTPLEDKLALDSAAAERAQLAQDYPEMSELGENEEFISWATGSPGRSTLATQSQQGSAQAARILLEQWRERQELISQAAPAEPATPEAPAAQAPVLPEKPQGVEGARLAVTEAGGTGAPPAQPTLTADEIVKTIINNPDLYRSQAYQEKVLEAAKAGTIDLNSLSTGTGYLR